MKTPVLIAARQEAAFIGDTLDKLDAATVEPIVIVNNSSDATAEIASSSGAQVFEIDEPGKLRAIQYGLQRLGKRALEPLLLTDADTYPLFPAKWAATMRRSLGGARVVSGLYVAHEDEPGFERHIVSTMRIANVVCKQLSGAPHASGANMMLHVQDESYLDQLLALPVGLQAEDLKIAQLLTPSKPLHPRVTLRRAAAVGTSSRYLPSTRTLLSQGRRATLKDVELSRIARNINGTLADSAP